MKCPRCSRKGKRQYHGYCTEVHRLLSEQQGKKIKLNCAVCDRPIFRTPSRIPKKGKAVCPRCSKNQGENHGNFKGAQYYNPKGYRYILVNGHYMLEHRHVWQSVNRSCFIPWQDTAIHHINFRKSDNRPINLLLLSDREHSRVHMLLKYGKLKEAYEVMHNRAKQQLFYPSNVEQFNPKVNQKKDTKENRLAS